MMEIMGLDYTFERITSIEKASETGPVVDAVSFRPYCSGCFDCSRGLFHS